MADKTPIDPGFLQRAAQGFRHMFGGGAGPWMSPGEPPQPMAGEESQQTKGRGFDYAAGANQQFVARPAGQVSYALLRGLADGYDLVRLLIETRKDQLAGLSFAIRPRDEKAKPNRRCQEVQTFLDRPDREHDWDEWVRMVVEELLVVDAATIYPRIDRAGRIYALEPLDGTTIKPLIDGFGRRPEPPNPAYLQILKGVPAVSYTARELVYRPRNVRVWRLGGFSPVEQIITTINIALRRQAMQLDYFQNGSVPDAVAHAPLDWQTSHIKEFQEHWDAMLAGIGSERRKLKFLPGGMTVTPLKQPPLKDEFEEWLARVCCFAFSVEHGPFVKAVNRATAQTSRNQSLSEGLTPLKQWLKRLIDFLIATYWGYADLELVWQEQSAVTPKEEAEVNQIYLAARVKTPNEIRGELGLDPLTPEQVEEIKALQPSPPSVPVKGKDGKEMTVDEGEDPEDEADAGYVTKARKKKA